MSQTRERGERNEHVGGVRVLQDIEHYLKAEKLGTLLKVTSGQVSGGDIFETSGEAAGPNREVGAGIDRERGSGSGCDKTY